METRCNLNCFIRLVVFLQVKRVMNGVFHSLRAEFDLHESYSGQVVLGIIVTTIKVKTDHNMIRFCLLVEPMNTLETSQIPVFILYLYLFYCA